MDTNSNIQSGKQASKQVVLVVILARFLCLLWWLGAASVPLLMNSYYGSYRYAIQCPISGDCYTPGSEHLFGIELLIGFSALAIWPLFVWYVIVKTWHLYRIK
jgi:hypothetical protein